MNARTPLTRALRGVRSHQTTKAVRQQFMAGSPIARRRRPDDRRPDAVILAQFGDVELDAPSE
jgi:hypothetical protein